MNTLYPEQQRKLRRLAHHLKPVVTIGGNGLTDAVQVEINQALHDHELIKVKIHSQDRDTLKAIATTICEAQEANLIQLIGHIVILYRKSEK